MKYNQYAVKNNNGEYIKYPTAYNYITKLTNDIKDIHLWDRKEDAEILANYLMKNGEHDKLTVVLI